MSGSDEPPLKAPSPFMRGGVASLGKSVAPASDSLEAQPGLSRVGAAGVSVCRPPPLPRQAQWAAGSPLSRTSPPSTHCRQTDPTNRPSLGLAWPQRMPFASRRRRPGSAARLGGASSSASRKERHQKPNPRDVVGPLSQASGVAQSVGDRVDCDWQISPFSRPLLFSAAGLRPGGLSYRNGC